MAAARFVALVVLDLRARAAALLGDADGAAIAYARLRPWARYFVVGGTGAWRSTAPPDKHRAALRPGKPGTAARHLRTATANQDAGLPPSELQPRRGHGGKGALVRGGACEQNGGSRALDLTVGDAGYPVGCPPG